MLTVSFTCRRGNTVWRHRRPINLAVLFEYMQKLLDRGWSLVSVVQIGA